MGDVQGNGQGRSDEFYGQVLQNIGAPVNPQTLKVLRAVGLLESGNPANPKYAHSASWNPFNTTQLVYVTPVDRLGKPTGAPKKLVPGQTWFNSFGTGGKLHVLNYPSEAVGVQATVDTLLQPQYAAIVKALRENRAGDAVVAWIKSPWSGASHYGLDPKGGPYAYEKTSLWKVYVSKLDAGAVQGYTPGQLPGTPDLAGALQGIADAVGNIGGLFSWVSHNMSRIGVAALGLLIIVFGVLVANKGGVIAAGKSVGKVAATAAVL